VAETELLKRLAQAPGLAAWRVRATQPVTSGFYLSHAVLLQRR
jgi:hypothetical protein